MPRYSAKNKATGEIVYFDWDGEQPPTQADVRRISDQQRQERINAKTIAAKNEEQSFTDKLLTSPVASAVSTGLDYLGLNQPWHPLESLKNLGQGVRKFIEGPSYYSTERDPNTGAAIPPLTTPVANPRTAGAAQAIRGAMGVAGPPGTAISYALAPIPTAAAMVTGNLASRGTQAALERTDLSPETKELLSTGAGLVAGGTTGYVTRGAPRPAYNWFGRANSQTSGPVKPSNARVNSIIVEMGPRRLPAGDVEYAPAPPPSGFVGPREPKFIGPRIPDIQPIEGLPKIEGRPQALLPERGEPIPPPNVRLGTQPIPLPAAGQTPEAVQPGPVEPWPVTRKGFMSPAWTPPPLQIPRAPGIEPPNEAMLQVSGEIEIPRDLTSATRPEPLSPAETPTVSSPAEQTLAAPRPIRPPVRLPEVIPPTPPTPTPAPVLPPEPQLPEQPPAPMPVPGTPQEVAPTSLQPEVITPQKELPETVPPPTPAAGIAARALARAKEELRPVAPPAPRPMIPPVTAPTAATPKTIAPEPPAPSKPPVTPIDHISTGTRDPKLINAVGKIFAKKPDITPEQTGKALKALFPESRYSEAAYTEYARGILQTKETAKPPESKPLSVAPVTPPKPGRPTTLPEVPPPNIQKAPGPVEPPTQLSPQQTKQVALNNRLIDFFKKRKDITVSQIQTEFGIPGDQVREMLADLRKRGLVTGDKGRYNYNKMPGEDTADVVSLKQKSTTVPQKEPELPKPSEPTGPRAEKIVNLTKELEGAEEPTLRKLLEGQISAQKKQAQLESGTKTQRALAKQIDDIESTIDRLETADENDPQLPSLYRDLTKLEHKRDQALIPEAEKYGPRVANLRSVHAEGELAGLDHEALSARAKAEYGVDSMSKMTPEQLKDFEESLHTERMEREAEILDLEEKDMEGMTTPEEKSKLKKFLKDETGSQNFSEALRYITQLLTSKGPNKGILRKQWAQSGETTLNKEGGGRLARDIRKMRTEGEVAAGNLIADFKANTANLTDPEFKNMLGVIRGVERAQSPKIAAAARVESARLTRIEARLGSRKVNIDPINTPRSDRAVLPDYYTAASSKIAEFENFGRRKASIPEDIRSEIDTIKRSGGDYRAAYRIADAYFNPDRLDDAQQAIWDKVSQFEILSKLGLSTISNMTQPANVALVTGNMTTFKAAIKSITKKGASKEFALRSGATLSSVTHETQLSEGVMPNTLASKMLEYNGFSPVEVNNRTIAALAGAEHAVNMFKRLKENPRDTFARRHLSHWLGLDPDLLVGQNKLTMDQVYTAAHTLSDRTQFRTSPLELPTQWKLTLTNRMLTLFKSFAFNQGKFMKEAILGEMKRGNFRPLIPLFTLFPILGTLADRAKRALAGREQPTEFWDTMIGAYSTVGGLGIVSDIATRAMAGKLAEWIIGPVVGDAVEMVDSVISDMQNGGNKTARFGTKQIPVVGRPFAYRAFPTGRSTSSAPKKEHLPSLPKGQSLPKLP